LFQSQNIQKTTPFFDIGLEKNISVIKKFERRFIAAQFGPRLSTFSKRPTVYF